jgi:hypothetical protein
MLFIAWVYRQVFECCRRVERVLFSQKEKDEDSVPVSDLPWMWIGAMYADCNVIDYTSVVNEAVQYGVNVDADWLQEVTNTNDEVTWLYLDPKSLEQKEFPSQGFVIYPTNDTFSDSSEDEDDSTSSGGSDSE